MAAEDQPPRPMATRANRCRLLRFRPNPVGPGPAGSRAARATTFALIFHGFIHAISAMLRRNISSLRK